MENIDEKSKQKIIALISALIPEAKIYLFGSRARGTHSKWSDIDLALDAGQKLSLSVLGEVISVIQGSNIPYTVEVVDIHRVSDEMKESILGEAIVWKQ